MWRGLTFDTLQHFNCGFFPEWGKEKTPRVIIPANNTNFLARLTIPVESLPLKIQQTIKPKQHSGSKTIFNHIALESNKPIIVVEGYKRTSNLTNNDKVVKSGINLEITMPIIKKGSKGLAVDIWNCILGNVCSVISFDETMDKQTRAFQEKHGLEVDGIVGKNSWTEGFKQV